VARVAISLLLSLCVFVYVGIGEGLEKGHSVNGVGIWFKGRHTDAGHSCLRFSLLVPGQKMYCSRKIEGGEETEGYILSTRSTK
jgi:hypothetical protein